MLRRLAIAILSCKTKILSCVYGFALSVQKRDGWLLRGRPKIIRRRRSLITIGKRFTACSQSDYNSIGVFQRVFIRTCQPNAVIVIGDNVGMSGCTISAHNSIEIGDNVLIGSGAMIMDSDAHSLDPAARRRGGDGKSEPIVIENDVFIGARAIVLKGVTVGRGSVVGAGAVVSKNVPPYSVVVGNPARVVSHLSRGGMQ